MAGALKVFGVGLNKTGTSSLGRALRRLGYRHLSHTPRLTRALARGDLAPINEAADEHDSFEDWPWPLVWREMDARYGDRARFVLTRRGSAERWVESLKAHAERIRPGSFTRRFVYGWDYPHGREVEHIAFYEGHNAAIRAHFDRPGLRNRFIELCWEEGDGWPALCGFLGQPVPAMPFPHANPRSAARADPDHEQENRRRIAAQIAGVRQRG
jgi:hypothetical protein